MTHFKAMNSEAPELGPLKDRYAQWRERIRAASSFDDIEVVIREWDRLTTQHRPVRSKKRSEKKAAT